MRISDWSSDVCSSDLLFVFQLQWLPGTSGMANGFDPLQLVMPVLTLVIYDWGYIARMTRASMAEVMTTHYIRTAVLKGLPYGQVIRQHALRSEEHTSELQSLMRISYAVFCLKKNNKNTK